ncbi:kinase-like domain-containing protein [Chlamydoabsidia padenii]|nr:kinase-like domain-containing protein [Chlamydoabsidia padenii]
MKRCDTTFIQPPSSTESTLPDEEDTSQPYYTCNTDSPSNSFPLSKQETTAYTSSCPVVMTTAKRAAPVEYNTHPLERKLSKLHHGEPTVLDGNESPTTPSTTTPSTYEPDIPDWQTHTDAWAFLQSLNPQYKSQYLTRQGSVGKSSTGYVFGRWPACDFIFTQNEISKKHCAIHMERGCNANQESGLSIYLEDFSSNGTFVNGVCVGPMNRVLLRAGDRIQLYRRDHYDDDDERHSFYRILLPPDFEVEEFHQTYLVGSRLGKGNFATVYKAKLRNEVLVEGSQPRYVAVKSIKKSKLDRKPRLLPSVIQEIGILMSLEAHPCVIKIEKVFDEPNHIYLVLEYVSGGDLFDLVAKKGLTESETRFIFFQLFAGIKFLHERQVAHRDMKPENVLVANANKLQIKITDFGLAKTTSTKKKVLDSQCGTPNYVAPEILDPTGLRAYTKSCDLWSLGVILYICLCGMPPFSEEMTLPGMKERIRNGIYSYDHRCWDSVSDEAKDLIDRLLTVDPNQRIDVENARTHKWFRDGLEDLRDRVQALDEGSQELLQYYESMPSVPMTQLT